MLRYVSKIKVVPHDFFKSHTFPIKYLNLTVCIVAMAVFHMTKRLYLAATVLTHLLTIRRIYCRGALYTYNGRFPPI
jgi:hypothetical protein